MVDPVTAALTGIALVTKVSEQIKKGIDAYKSVSEIGQEIDLLFKGEQECQKARNKKASGFSTESVAQEVIDAKLAQEKLQQVAVMVDMRFGPGTWAGILAERQRRIQEAKEAAKQAEIERRRKQHQWEENLKIAATALVAIIVIVLCLTVAANVFATVNASPK